MYDNQTQTDPMSETMYNVSISVVGHVGRDGCRWLQGWKTPTLAINVCANQPCRNPDGSRGQVASWFEVLVFGRQAQACAQYLRQGSQVLVQGTYRASIGYGANQQAYLNQHIHADRVIFLDRPQAAPAAPQQPVPAPAPAPQYGYPPQQPAPAPQYGYGYPPQQPAPQYGYGYGYPPQQPAPAQPENLFAGVMMATPAPAPEQPGAPAPVPASAPAPAPAQAAAPAPEQSGASAPAPTPEQEGYVPLTPEQMAEMSSTDNPAEPQAA